MFCNSKLDSPVFSDLPNLVINTILARVSPLLPLVFLFFSIFELDITALVIKN
jgi:hypothetical protein